MTFNKVDIDTWNRKEIYSKYLNDIPCSYSMTVNIDITKLLTQAKKQNIKFFPSILFAISRMVNEHKEFRMDINENGEVGYYTSSNPYFTIFHEKQEIFTNVWTEYSENFNIFLENYFHDMSIYQNNYSLSKPLKNKNIFTISVIPWATFTGFNLNLQKGYTYFPPIFTLGKYYTENDKVLLPLSIQVHHAVCDGFHLARFINDLQSFIDGFLLESTL